MTSVNIDSNYHNLYQDHPPANNFQRAIKYIWENQEVVPYDR